MKRHTFEIQKYYQALFRSWGPQHWWPAESRIEMIVGAYLTQNTTWANVEKALTNLRLAQILSLSGIRETPVAQIESLIRPAGYFRQKAKRLKLFVEFLDQHYGGSLDKLFSSSTDRIRKELLSLEGIGPETADSILLYAGNHPVFVVDAYTRRILARHLSIPEKTSYEEIRKLFEGALASMGDLITGVDADESQEPAVSGGSSHSPSAVSMAKRSALVQIYNEMHGLIVGVGKNYCRKSQPKCDGCPLQKFLPQP